MAAKGITRVDAGIVGNVMVNISWVNHEAVVIRTRGDQEQNNSHESKVSSGHETRHSEIGIGSRHYGGRPHHGQRIERRSLLRARPHCERDSSERHERKKMALDVFVTASNVVNQEIEPAVLLPDAADQQFDLRVAAVIASHGDATAAAVSDLPGGFVDRARHMISGRSSITSNEPVHAR